MSKEKIIAAYEALADQYDKLIDHKPHNAYYDRPNTLGLMPPVQGKKILDAACGPGKYAEILLADGAELTGFDISPRMVALARERNGNQGTFYVQDMSQPLARCQDGEFDFVVCALAMHYLEDWNPTLREFHRVLKPGGALILSIEHPFFNYTYFQSERYFDIEPVQATWTGFGIPVEVNCYRRPLESCLMPLLNSGFQLDRLLEPKPVPEFEKFDPKHYKELNDFPAFLCLRAIRREMD